MSKRTRGSRSSRTRPGYRPAAQRPATKAPAVSRPQSVAEAAVDEFDLAEPAPEQAAGRPAVQRPGRGARGAAAPGSARASGLLAAKAQTEYAYVSQDIRRIVRFATAIFGTMAVLWVLIGVTGVVKL